MNLSNINPGSINPPNMYTFIKDKDLRFVTCNENLAESIGLDSPEQIKHKDDFQLCWREKAEFYQKIDSAVLQSQLTYVNVVETQQRPEATSRILITKTPIFDSSGICIGIVGSYIDIPDLYVFKKVGYFDRTRMRFYLGDVFGNEYLTHREYQVLKLTIHAKSAKQIAKQLKISPRTVEEHITHLKRKLQCTTKGDIFVAVVTSGLIYSLMD